MKNNRNGFENWGKKQASGVKIDKHRPEQQDHVRAATSVLRRKRNGAAGSGLGTTTKYM
jgi:hypothetical protein